MAQLEGTGAHERTGVSRLARSSAADLAQRYGIVIFLLLMVAFFYFQNERFLSARNISNVLTDVSIFGIMAVGMTFVILTAGIDLSVGSLLAFCAMVAALLIKGSADRYEVGVELAFHGYSWAIALAVCIVVGLLAGALHGFIVARLKVPAFVVTLGAMTVWRGLTLMLGNGAPIAGFDTGLRWWGTGTLAGVPVPVIVFAITVVIGHVALRYTRYGRQVYAVGGNIEAARLTGLRVPRIIASVYIIAGALSGLAGFLLTARLNSAEVVAGAGYELRVIASVVIGGTSLFGGAGTILGTVVGSLIIGVMLNGLVMMNVSSYVQEVVVGCMIVIAVLLDQVLKDRSRTA